MSATPGPWEVVEHSWCETSISAHGFDHAICRLDINHATEESQEADEAIMAANARLISAAPDMLEALRRVAPELRGLALLSREAEKLSSVVDAAIAKATGDAA